MKKMNNIYINNFVYTYNISMSQFSELSHSLTKKLTTIEKKKDGIYFTPYNIIQKSVDIIDKDNIKGKTILEPSCGSCEFINYLDKIVDGIEITGIEYNKKIYDEIKNIEFNNVVNVINEDFLNYESNIKYDIIIGNPPYYVIPKKEVNKQFINYFDGRPNIFILFIIKSLTLLSDKGILSFVLPKNFLNCLYYDKLRKYIYNNYKIIKIIDCDNEKFIETGQETIIFVLQNIKDSKSNDKYCIKIKNYTIFNSEYNVKEIKDIYKDSYTLDKLKFNVSVGNVVWNQVKNILTNDPKKTRLIYSSDIVKNKLIVKKYKDEAKKNYIDKKGNNDLVLVINRGYGKGKYKFNYCIIDIKEDYLIENHLIVIKYNETIDKNQLIKLYEQIIKSFNNEKTEQFINIYFGNNAINTTELQYILPIFIS